MKMLVFAVVLTWSAVNVSEAGRYHDLVKCETAAAKERDAGLRADCMIVLPNGKYVLPN